MTNRIPTIELRKASSGGPTMVDVYAVTQVGTVSTSSSPFEFDITAWSGSLQIDIWDVYEDGVAMVDGRQWQSPCDGSLLVEGTPVVTRHRIPLGLPRAKAADSPGQPRGSARSINAPMMYRLGTADNIWTLIYYSFGDNLFTQPTYLGFMRGQFVDMTNGYCYGQDSTIPLIFDSAYCSGTWIADAVYYVDAPPYFFTLGAIDSSAWQWELSYVKSNIQVPGLVPCVKTSTVSPLVPSYEREQQVKGFQNTLFSVPTLDLGFAHVNSKGSIIASARSCGSAATFRRADTSATYLWPGGFAS